MDESHDHIDVAYVRLFVHYISRHGAYFPVFGALKIENSEKHTTRQSEVNRDGVVHTALDIYT